MHHFDVKRGCVTDLKYAREELRLSARQITFGEPASLPSFVPARTRNMDERDKGAGDPR